MTGDGHVPTSGIASAQQEARRAQDWLLHEALPLWGTRGRTASGLFAERMSLDGLPDESYFRTFVQARHIYAFATAARLGWTGRWQDLVNTTLDILLARARRRDGFFVHQLSASADVLDGRADLYDQAFVLFALGTAGGALERAELFNVAESLLNGLEQHWSAPDGGFREGEVADPRIRRQNPHMHLFEAFLALFEASGRQRFFDAAATIAQLARDRFIDPASGALREYFDHEWQPSQVGVRPEGDIVEPGHCCEWAWLFERLAAMGWEYGIRISDSLTDFARRHGVDPGRGVMIDEVWIDGEVRSTRARCWPQTERTKVAVLRWLRTSSETEAAEITAAARGLAPYLAVSLPGLWRDKMNGDGSWQDEPAPGSSLYHIACAIAEMARVTELSESVEQTVCEMTGRL